MTMTLNPKGSCPCRDLVLAIERIRTISDTKRYQDQLAEDLRALSRRLEVVPVRLRAQMPAVPWSKWEGLANAPKDGAATPDWRRIRYRDLPVLRSAVRGLAPRRSCRWDLKASFGIAATLVAGLLVMGTMGYLLDLTLGERRLLLVLGAVALGIPLALLGWATSTGLPRHPFRQATLIAVSISTCIIATMTVRNSETLVAWLIGVIFLLSGLFTGYTFGATPPSVFLLDKAALVYYLYTDWAQDEGRRGYYVVLQLIRYGFAVGWVALFLPRYLDGELTWRGLVDGVAVFVLAVAVGLATSGIVALSVAPREKVAVSSGLPESTTADKTEQHEPTASGLPAPDTAKSVRPDYLLLLLVGWFLGRLGRARR